MAKKRLLPWTFVLIGDLHIGGTTAICPSIVRLDDGGTYHGSEAQRWIYEEKWLPFWRVVDEEVARHKSHLGVLVNGDVLEGDHHRTMQIISRNPEASAYILDVVLRETLIKRKPKRLYFVRGTSAHGGESAHTEEAIARGLSPLTTRHPDTKTWSAYEWRWEVYGVQFHALHHGKLGRKPNTRAGTVLHGEVADLIYEFVRDQERPPDICVRSHNHKFAESGRDNHPVYWVALPCWQLQTEWGWRVAGSSPADVGGSIVTVFPDGEWTIRNLYDRPKRSTVDVIV